MADINRELEELAELTQRVNREFAMFGQLTRETAEEIKDAEMQQKHGIKNFTAATEKGGEAVINLGKAMGQAASSMYQGKKGAAAFNDSVDSMADAAKAASVALLLLGGPLGMLAAAVTASIAALGSYTKAANEMSDKLYKGYQGLAESGAAASDGMTGLFNDAKKLGISMNDLDGYVQLIGENANSLALFSGTVFEGRRKFADMGKSMEQYREGLMNAGLTQEQINAGMMSYLKLQSRVGLTQNKTTTELADGARKYLLEMDALSKVTGESRKSMEDQMEAARSEERFAAKLQELRSQGRVEEAKQLEKTNLILASQSKEAAQGFRDLSTGMITTEAAQKANILTQGEAMKQADRLSKGLTTAGDAATAIGTAAGKTANALTPLAKAGAAGNVIGDYAGGLRLGIAAANNFGEQLKKAEAEQKNQGATGGKAADAAVQAQTDLRLAQQKANEATERFVFAGIVPATEAMIVLAKATAAGTESLNKMFGIAGSGGPGASAAVKSQERKKSDAEIEAAEKQKEAAFKNATMLQKIGIGRTEEQQKAAEKLNKIYETRAKLEIDLAGGYDANGMPVAGVMQPGQAKAPAPASAAPRSAAPASAAPRSAAPASAAPTSAAPASAAPATPKEAAGPEPHSSPVSSGGGAGGKPQLVRVGSKTGKSTMVNADYAPQFQGVIDYLDSVGYNIYSLGGYVDRDVRGQPGKKSVHAHGGAIDINPAENPLGSKLITDMPPEISQVASRLGLGWGGNWNSIKDAMHFSVAKNEGGTVKLSEGGVLTGPQSGYRPDIEMHGTEAIIPLKNGAVPVSLDMRNAMQPGGIGPTAFGMNEFTGYNSGPLTTDLDAIKDIAAKLGAYDASTKLITDPTTWKQILSSGIATNYDLGMAEIGTKMIPGIGADIGERIKELKDAGGTGTDTVSVIKQVTDEFRSAMAQMIQPLADMSAKQNETGTAGVTELLQELLSATKSGVSVQQKILATNY